jgi:hypothetical protein
VTGDFGGSTFRKMGFEYHPGERQVRLAETPLVIKTQFTSARQLGTFIGQNLGKLPAGQNIVPISFAGPVAKDMRTLLKYTNQTGMVERNIPFADIIEASYKEATGFDITVFLLHDCLAAAWAIANKGGVLAEAKIGTWFNPIVHGTGVGGQNYEIIQPGVVAFHDGNFEFGHEPIAWDLLEELQLADIMAPTQTCGCERQADRNARIPLCFELAAAGPAIQRYGRTIFGNIKLIGAAGNKSLKSKTDDLARLQLSPAELVELGLTRQVLTRINRTDLLIPEKAAEALELVIENIDAPDFTNDLRASDGVKYTAGAVIARVARLFAHRLAQAQAHHLNRLNFVFVGGAGINLGPFMFPHIHDEVARMNAQKRRCVWDIERHPDLTIMIDTFPADVTNSAGAIYWLMNYEDAQDNLEM